MTRNLQSLQGNPIQGRSAETSSHRTTLGTKRAPYSHSKMMYSIVCQQPTHNHAPRPELLKALVPPSRAKEYVKSNKQPQKEKEIG